MPVNGAEEREVLPSVTLLNFAIAREGIYFVPRPDAAGHRSIGFFSFAAQKTRPVLAIPNPAGPGLAISPDGKILLYTLLEPRASDLMLVENFR